MPDAPDVMHEVAVDVDRTGASIAGMRCLCCSNEVSVRSFRNSETDGGKV